MPRQPGPAESEAAAAPRRDHDPDQDGYDDRYAIPARADGDTRLARGQTQVLDRPDGRAPGRSGSINAGPDAGVRRRGASPAGEPGPGRRRAAAGGRTSRRGTGQRGLGVLTWTAVGLVIAVTAGAVTAFLVNSGPGGPAHTLVTPARLGAYMSNPQLGQQMDVPQLKQNIVKQSAGAAKDVVSAVYENGPSSPGGPAPDILLFIGGRLAGASPSASIRAFTSRFTGATMTSAGPMGGEAACVSGQPGTGGALAVCAWFDNDTFGEVVSPNLSVTALANEMRTIRPSVERVSR